MMNKMDGKFTFSNEFMTKIKEEKKLGNNVFGSLERLVAHGAMQCMVHGLKTYVPWYQWRRKPDW